MQNFRVGLNIQVSEAIDVIPSSKVNLGWFRRILFLFFLILLLFFGDHGAKEACDHVGVLFIAFKRALEEALFFGFAFGINSVVCAKELVIILVGEFFAFFAAKGDLVAVGAANLVFFLSNLFETEIAKSALIIQQLSQLTHMSWLPLNIVSIPPILGATRTRRKARRK